MINATRNIILLEIAKPIILANMLNYEAGIWFWTITHADITVTDDHANEGYYDYVNLVYRVINSLQVDTERYLQVDSLADVRITPSSFFYDTVTTRLYIRFTGWEPPLSKTIWMGCVFGYSYNNSGSCYYNDIYYEPRISKLFPIKKSIDPLFWGLLKYQAAKVELINNDGGQDDWRNRHLFSQKSVIKKGNQGDGYDNFQIIHQGFVENDTRGFEKFSVDLQDERKNLTTKIIQSYFAKTPATIYAYLSDTVDKSPIPISWGKIYGATAICVNPDDLIYGCYFYIFQDITFHTVVSIDQIYVNGVKVTKAGSADGYFWITSAQAGDHIDDVTIDFTASTADNGVSLIKELMLSIGGVSFIADFWDLDEVNTAEAAALDTSIYVDDDTKTLIEVIEQICVDIGARFFQHDDGRWTVRLYNANKTPIDTISADEWLDEPEFSSNAKEYLTDVTVLYKKNQGADGFRGKYSNTTHKDDIFNIYKKYKTTTYETHLIDSTAAIARSEMIMNISGNPQDIITRTTTMDHDALEITDFITASPATRYGEDEDPGVYEIVEISKDYEKNNIKLSLRKV